MIQIIKHFLNEPVNYTETKTNLKDYKYFIAIIAGLVITILTIWSISWEM